MKGPLDDDPNVGNNGDVDSFELVGNLVLSLGLEFEHEVNIKEPGCIFSGEKAFPLLWLTRKLPVDLGLSPEVLRKLCEFVFIFKGDVFPALHK